MTEHRVKIAAAKGRWSVEYGGAVIGEFADPEAAAARYLLDHGLASLGDTLTTYRGDMRCFTGNVGRLAGVALPVRPVNERKLAGLTGARPHDASIEATVARQGYGVEVPVSGPKLDLHPAR